jgi:hypothetical protein
MFEELKEFVDRNSWQPEVRNLLYVSDKMLWWNGIA